MTDREYSVYQWLADGSYRAVKRWIGAREAVELSKAVTERPESARVIVTDGGDHCCFEWIKGKGVTFPTREELDAHRKAEP